MPKLDPSDILARLTQIDGDVERGVSQTSDPTGRPGGEGEDAPPRAPMASGDRPPSSSSGSMRAELGLDSVQQQALLDKVSQRLFGSQQRAHVIGRFEVLRRVGIGGMGVVYLARDPRLDRKVAIKLLHPRRATQQALERAEARMRIEARAMARISHSNVVHIHEVGVHDGQLFLAMEYVAGTTLERWLKRKKPDWRAIVAVFCQAGEGLGAAHAAGLVHRDFKPDNVLVGDDRSVKVTDFGVAAVGQRWEELVETADGSSGDGDSEVTLGGSSHPHSSANSLTTTGTRIGTPLYMSPEQFLSTPTDGRSDQFSFCEALREALLGEHPFRAESLSQLTMAVTCGKLRPRPKERAVPDWVLDIVERGLSKKAEDRWESMEVLVEALRADPLGRRRRVASAVAGVGLFGLLAGGMGVTLAEPAAVVAAPDCGLVSDAERGALEGFWDPQVRAPVAAVLEAAEVPEGEGRRVLASLDGYAQSWLGATEAACIDENDPGARLHPWTAERTRCLELGRVALGELSRSIIDAGARGRLDGPRLDRVLLAAETLPPVDRCVDFEDLAVRAPSPDDPDLGTQVDELRRELVRGRTQLLSGDTAGALVRARAVVSKTEDLGFAPLSAEARMFLGRVEFEADRPLLAVATLRQALLEAEATGHGLLASEAGTHWIQARLRAESVSPELLGWAELVAAKLEHRGDDSSWARYHCTMLQAQNAAAAHELALEHGQACLDHNLAAHGPTHVEVARALGHLAHTELILGDSKGGIAHAKEAVRIARETRRESHQAVLRPRRTMGSLYALAGDYERARAIHHRNVELIEAERGPAHSEVADELIHLAQAQVELGEVVAARAALERALDIHEESLGAHHVRVAGDLAALAQVHVDAGELDLARAKCRRALAIVEGRSGHRLEAATFVGILGRVELAAGHPMLAMVHQRRAQSLAELALGSESPHLHYFLADLGEALVAAGELDEARAMLARALEMVEGDPSIDGALVAVRLEGLGKAELEGDDAARNAGRAHLELARESYQEAGDAAAVERVGALLAEP